MPARSHLNWTRLKEFGGLWTAGAQTLMPADRAQVMAGCHPQPGGGLRAFFKVTETVDNTGLTALGSDEYATGFGILLRGPFATDDPADVVLMMVTVGTGTEPIFDDWKVWRWESDKGATSWSMSTALGVTTGILSNPPRQSQFAQMLIGQPLGVRKVYLTLFMQEAALDTSGLYEYDPDDGTLTRIDATLYGGQGVVQHQARLVTGHGDLIQFTAPGTETFPTTGGLSVSDPPADPASGYVRPNPAGFFFTDETGDVSEESAIVWMVAVPPGDLFVATRDGRVYNIQGDLGDPIVRELGRLNTAVPQEPVATPSGLYVIEPNRGVVRMTFDGSVQNASPDILPTVWTLRTPRTGLGQLAASGRFIFAPNQHNTADHRNGALVFDTELSAWFTSTHEDEHVIRNPRFMAPSPDYRESGVWLVSGAAPGDLADGDDFAFHIRTGSSDSVSPTDPEARNAVFEWKSAPFRAPEGRRTIIRELEIPVYAWNATSTLSVTIGSTTHVVDLPAGRSHQSVLFREEGDELDITLLSESNDPDDEAPMIEELHVGWRTGAMIR